MDIKTAIILILVTTGDVVSEATYNASACFGSDWSTCSTLLMDKCTRNQNIQIIDQNYGVTVGTCLESSHNESCLRSGSGCCAYKEGDCLAGYTQLHSYNFHRQCSGKSSCTTSVGRAYVNCNGRSEISRYATITYACIKDIVNMCSQSLTNMEEVHMIFDKQTSPFMVSSKCGCKLTSPEPLLVNYVDIRMANDHTESERTNCSSAYLTSDPPIKMPAMCDDAIDESSNFLYGTVVYSNTRSLVITLTDLYKLGHDDAPEYVWIAVSARNNAQVEVTCIQTISAQYTTRATATVSQTEYDDTVNADVGGFNVGMIVAVTVAAVILLVAGIGAYTFYRKRRKVCVKCTEVIHGKHNKTANVSRRVPFNNFSNIVEYDEQGVDAIVTPALNTDHSGQTSSESTHEGKLNVYSVIPYIDQRTSEYVLGTIHNKNTDESSQSQLAFKGTLEKLKQRTRGFAAIFKKQAKPIPSLYRSHNVSVTSLQTKKGIRKSKISSPIPEEKYRHSKLTKMTGLKKKWINQVNPDLVAYENLTNADIMELKVFHIGEQYGECTFKTADDVTNVPFQTKSSQQTSPFHNSSCTLTKQSDSNVEQHDLNKVQCENEYAVIDESDTNENGIDIVKVCALSYNNEQSELQGTSIEKGLCLDELHNDDDTQCYITPMSTFKYNASNETTSVNESRFEKVNINVC